VTAVLALATDTLSEVMNKSARNRETVRRFNLGRLISGKPFCSLGIFSIFPYLGWEMLF
jgi:hypothetical protein